MNDNISDKLNKIISEAADADLCKFDGLPMHPHYYYFLTCAGFKSLSEIEEKTEDEFSEIMNNAKTRSGRPVSHKAKVGRRMADFLKNMGLVFREE